MVYILRNVETGVTAVLGVNGSYTLGRSEVNNIHLRNKYSTRNHALIAIKDGYATISDVGSKRGTFVNKAKIQDETKLQNGDVILFGSEGCEYCFIDPKFSTVIDDTLTENIKIPLQEALKELNVTILDNYAKECSYYTTESITLDILKKSRLLDAVIDGKPVVKPKFWIDMFDNISKGAEIPNKYIYTPEIEESLRNKGLDYITPKMKRKQLFEDMLFIFFDQDLQKRVRNLILKCGGGTQLHNNLPDFATTLTEGKDFLEAIIITEQRVEQPPLTVTYFMDKLRQLDKSVKEMSEMDIYVTVLKGRVENTNGNGGMMNNWAVENAIFSDTSDDSFSEIIELPKPPTTSKQPSIEKPTENIILKKTATPSSKWLWRSKKSNTAQNPGGSTNLDTNLGDGHDKNKDTNNKHRTKDKNNKAKDSKRTKAKEKHKDEGNEGDFNTSLSMSSSSDDETNIKKEIPEIPHKNPLRINPVPQQPPTPTKGNQNKPQQKKNRQRVMSEESLYIVELSESPIRIISDSEPEELQPQTKPQEHQEKPPRKKNGQRLERNEPSISILDSSDYFRRKTRPSSKQSGSCADAEVTRVLDDDSEDVFNPAAKRTKVISGSDDTTLSLECEPEVQRKTFKLNPFATPIGSSTPKPEKSKNPTDLSDTQRLNEMFTDVDFLPM